MRACPVMQASRACCFAGFPSAMAVDKAELNTLAALSLARAFGTRSLLLRVRKRPETGEKQIKTD